MVYAKWLVFGLILLLAMAQLSRLVYGTHEKVVGCTGVIVAKLKKVSTRKPPTKLEAFSQRISKLLTVDRLMIGGTILAMLAILGYFVLNRDPSPPDLDPNVPDNSVAVEIQPAEHIEPGEPHDPYSSNPPTSGWHFGSPAGWGIYDRVLPDGNVIHDLEHGGAWISYTDDVDEDAIKELEEIASRYSSHVILSPRPDNDSPIAVAAWGRLLELDEVDSGQIHNFILRYRFQGPEDVR